MELYRAYYTMISGGHLSACITTVMKLIVALGRQLPDGPLGKIVVYREFTVIQVCKNLFPAPVQVIKGFRIILAFAF